MTVVLVDTHIALWALGEPDRLADSERSLLSRSDCRSLPQPHLGLGGSDQTRSRQIARPQETVLPILAAQFRMLAITTTLLEQAAELPKHHLDPFDRVLIAHALHDDLEVMTRDRAFASYGVRLATPTAKAD